MKTVDIPSWTPINKFMELIDQGKVPENWRECHYGDNPNENDFRIPVSAIGNVVHKQMLLFMVSTRFKYPSMYSVYQKGDDIVSIANHDIMVEDLFYLMTFNKIIDRNPQMNFNYKKFVEDAIDDLDDIYGDLYDQFYPFWETPEIFECLINVSSEYDIKKLGAVNTPYSLVSEIVGRLPDAALSGTCLDPACGHGTFLYEVQQRLIRTGTSQKEANKNLYGVDIDLRKCYIASAILDPQDNGTSQVFWANALTGTNSENSTVQDWYNMTFDLVLGNPPFQSPQNADGKKGGGTTLWDKFVVKAFDDWTVSNGYVALIHPANWRNYRGDYVESRKALLNGNQMTDLNIYSGEETNKIFGVGTRVDAYIVAKGQSGTTKIRDEDGNLVEKDLNTMTFIPNSNFDLYESLVAKDGEERVEVLYSRRAYASDTPWTSTEQSDDFKYPVLHSIRKSGDHYILWSSRNDNGHFGVPKVVFGVGPTDIIVDIVGEYGLSQHTRAIVDSVENLKNIAEVLKSDAFMNLMKSAILSDGKHPDVRNKDVLALFRKDFWKEFI